MQVEIRTVFLLVFCCPMKCRTSLSAETPRVDLERSSLKHIWNFQNSSQGSRNASQHLIEIRKLGLSRSEEQSFRNPSSAKNNQYRRLLQYLGPLEHFKADDNLQHDRIYDVENLIPADETDPLLSAEPAPPTPPYTPTSKKRVFPGVAIGFLIIGLGLFTLACYVSDGHILHADNKTMCWLIMGSGFEVLVDLISTVREPVRELALELIMMTHNLTGRCLLCLSSPLWRGCSWPAASSAL